ncbi:MAG: FAD-dependent monooxygenase, partial [Leptospiraceae bacterium]|nr:FAD-dependent monooxygenase [Leptospiraceae bacterium]
MRIAINGCGIAGPALAWWLKRYGFEPTIFEKADAPRSGGYLIDFWGEGYAIAEKMGLLSVLKARAHNVEEMRIVSREGAPIARLSLTKIREQLGGRFLSISRGDVAIALYEALDSIPVRFGKSVLGFRKSVNEQGVELNFSDGTSESFDLLIGADGLHSHVRQILFKETPEKEMGACVAAFTAHDYRYKDDSAYVLYQSDKKQMARTTLADGRTMFLLTFRSELVPEGASIDDPRPLLRTIYEGSGWESETALQAMDDSDDLYFDRVSQIRLDHWSDGPVALIGDAAACASLLAGEGTGLAMIESYVLAGELYRADGDYSKAFRNYEERLSKFLRKKQNAARSMVAF